jgi:hypothetical protein
MKLEWTRPETVSESGESDRRASTTDCDSCQTQRESVIYFRFRGSYCGDCAPLVFGATGRRSAGRRADDSQYPPPG